MSWFSLCDGAHLPVCHRCRRLESNYRVEELTNRSWLRPIVERGACADFMQKPEAEKRNGTPR